MISTSSASQACAAHAIVNKAVINITNVSHSHDWLTRLLKVLLDMCRLIYVKHASGTATHQPSSPIFDTRVADCRLPTLPALANPMCMAQACLCSRRH